MNPQAARPTRTLCRGPARAVTRPEARALLIRGRGAPGRTAPRAGPGAAAAGAVAAPAGAAPIGAATARRPPERHLPGYGVKPRAILLVCLTLLAGSGIVRGAPETARAAEAARPAA